MDETGENKAPQAELRDTEIGGKGLKGGALGFLSNVVIGVASTAPGYSLAATLGFIVAVPGVGLSAPAVLLVSFLPMLCIAYAFRELNKADPDCGTPLPGQPGRSARGRAGWAAGGSSRPTSS